jgi:LemA protein
MAVDSERELAAAAQSFFAVAESYPELKSNANFMALQKELAMTEDRIAAARRFFNANIRDFNTMLESFPSSLMAGGRRKQAYFDAEEISFSPGLGL